MSLILVVEDNDDISELLTVLLGSQGHQVVVKPNGEEALELCTTLVPELILLDVALAGRLDGLDVTRVLRADDRYRDQYREVPIILLTARAHQDDIAAGYEAGADTYLVKPFRAQSLMDVVARSLSPAGPSPDDGS